MKRVRNFCITDNNYGDQDIEIFKSISCIKYGVLGKEVGEKNGTPHLQGYVQLKEGKTLKAFQTILKNAGLRVSIIIAKANWQKNHKYCSKDNNYVEWGIPKKQGARNDIHNMYDAIKEGKSNYYLQENYTVAYSKYYKACDRIRQNLLQQKNKEHLFKTYQGAKLRDWQKDVSEKLEQQDDRKITWVCDPIGNKGKTWYAKHLVSNKKAFYVRGGKTADIAYAYNYEPVVVFDFTKSQEEFVNYSTIECFKDGMIFSPKYNSITKIFPSCKVICFSNFEPSFKELSRDRWDYVQI